MSPSYADWIALDARTGRTLWHAARPAGSPTVVKEPAGRELVLSRGPDSIDACDLASGASVWRARTVDRGRVRIMAAGRRVILAGEHLEALDLGTGRRAWARPLWPSGTGLFCGIGADSEHVVAQCPRHSLVVYAARDGRELSRASSPHGEDIESVFVQGDRAWIATTHGGVDAIELPGGRRSWSRDVDAGYVAFGGDALFACTTGGVVRALSIGTGATLWSWGMGDCGAGRATPLARVGVAHGTAAVLIVEEADGLVGFRRRTTPAAAEQVVIEGTARVNGRTYGGLGVHVDDEVVTTDARGHYRAPLSARGKVRVVIDQASARRVSGRPCGWSVPQQVPLDGSKHYGVDPIAKTEPFQCDAACNCD